MRSIIGKILHTICCGVIGVGLFIIIDLYLNDFRTDNIFAINVFLITIVSVIQSLLQRIDSKRYINIIPEWEQAFQLADKVINLIAWKKQINYTSIVSVLIGIINITLFFISPIQHKDYILNSGLFVIIPFLGFYVFKRELAKYSNNVQIDIKNIRGIYHYDLGDTSIVFKIDDLRYTQKIDTYILARTAKNNEFLIFPINNK